jgi:amino acid adenylation domain-containing protein
VTYPGMNLCLHQLIEEQSRRTPDRVALRFEQQRLTYGELDHRASQLAQHLRRLEVGPDVLVGLFVERSLEMVVGILGVLKAGAAYLPIDTSYPQERLAFMCADANVRLLLTHSSLLAKLPTGATQVVRLDEFDWNGSEGATQSYVRVHPEHLAYVIYTSGSTGRPKGVCIEHRNIVNYVLGIVERLQLEPGMTHATVSTIAADLGNTVIFPALVTGGCLHIISQERAESQAMLSDYFSRERIDVLKIVPSHLAALQSGQHPEQVMPRKRLILGGEASRLDWIERLRALSPECEIYNHYGPTETTVGVLAYHVDTQLPNTRSGTLPLGRPLPNSRIYLLDGEGRSVPIGDQGELYIGGCGVARGYLNRPDLTAEKFVPDPFSPDPRARLYRTGDLGRCLPDGSIEFCGRIDYQVKLHGYRVELGEIEGALREHGSVQDAVVLARQDESGDKQMVAYVIASQANQPPSVSEQVLTPTTLREYLKGRLPHYMVPSAFVLMARFPLTSNGKIDRQALADFSIASKEPSHDFVRPRTETEKALAVIWAELLKVENIGINDDVFDLGAHSLMAMKALTQIRDVFEVNLSLRNLFEHPTVAGLAEIIDGLSWLAKAKTPSQDGGDREEFVL